MQRGMLAAYFRGVVRKKLAMVEVNPKVSNQHELNATAEVRHLLGPKKRNFPTQFLYFEAEQASINEQGFTTYYDARERHPTRTEYRIYFNTNSVTQAMEEGDVLFFAIRADDTALFVVASQYSAMVERLNWLFGLDHQVDFKFESNTFSDNERGELDFLSRQILESLGIEYEDPMANEHDTIIERFGLTFPNTKDFSDLARLTLPSVNAKDDPDAALIAWLNHEEALFRRLEKRIVSQRLVEGFIKDGEPDVDEFVQYSLSVQNRRKSRMGRCLENHLVAIFNAHEIRYASQFKTFKGKKPDFIFPSAKAYQDAKFPTALLTMLAAKSSCKERWSQVLSEADRISEKHLLTLELGLPETTTDVMRADNLQLIIPTSLQQNYSKTQKQWLLNLSDFIALVIDRQTRAIVC